MSQKLMERGTQIAYVPRHAGGDLGHPDVEFGFVTTVCENGDCYCRYWSKWEPGELRTKANSERTPADYLVVHESKSHAELVTVMQRYGL